MKCELCRKEIAELFLKKIKGTYVKDAKGKQHIICSECQKHVKTKEEMITGLPL